MILVIDTNVVISAALRDGLPGRVLQTVIGRDDWQWMVTPALLAEYESVIRRSRLAIPADAQEEWLQVWRDNCTVLDLSYPYPDFPRDRKDAHVLHAALVVEADYLITGDKDFAEAQALIPSRIVTVREFAQIARVA